MRKAVLALLAPAALLLSAGGTLADSAISVKTTFYNVSGASGLDLIKAMDRKGPRHGFMARAIAQTSYTVGWEFTWERENKTCRLAEAQGTLDMTYTYPRIANSVSPDLKRRWNRFMVGVRKHEEQHGAMAKEMVRAAERSVKGLSVAGDPKCRRAQAEAKRRIGATYSKYEARQIAFDSREHKGGGNVEKLLLALAGKR